MRVLVTGGAGLIGSHIVDLLMPPLSALELTAGVAGGGVTRGVVVGSIKESCGAQASGRLGRA